MLVAYIQRHIQNENINLKKRNYVVTRNVQKGI